MRDPNADILIKKIFTIEDIQAKSSWRIKFIKRQLESVKKRHQRLPYKQLIDRYCPIGNSQDVSSTLSQLSYHQVYLFLRAVLNRLLPVQLFGSVSNRSQFFKGKFNILIS